MISPSFLLAKESNPALLHILLETISNIIEHQHSQNQIFLYAIIRNHAKFQAFQHFDLQKALADLDDRKAQKPEKDSAKRAGPTGLETPVKQSFDVSTPTTPVTPSAAFSVGDDDEEQGEDVEVMETRPLSEKARGKLPEGVELPRRESTFSTTSGVLSPTVERREFHPTEAWVPLQPPFPPPPRTSPKPQANRSLFSRLRCFFGGVCGLWTDDRYKRGSPISH